MHGYYAKLLSKYKDVVTVQDVVALTGYAKTTVNNWCNRGELKSFRKGQLFYIPKIFLIDFSRLVKEYAEKEGVTEQLKSADQMKWVQKMNSIRVCVTGSVIRELIFI